MDRLPEGDDTCEWLERAKTAASRCADMSRRLIHLGRETSTIMSRVDIAAALIEAQQLLECVKPRNIRVSINIQAGLFILGDATQIQQVLINLGTNAFRAMERAAIWKSAPTWKMVA